MDSSTWLWLIIIGLFALAIWGFVDISSKSQKKQDMGKSLATDTFKPDRVLIKAPAYGNSVAGVAVDAPRKTVCLINGDSKRYIDSSDLIESEVQVDGKSVTKTSRASQFAGAAIGGVLFGGVGAVIGGLTGKSTTSVDAKGVKLKLVVNELENPVHVVDFIEATAGGTTHPPTAQREANEWHELLSTIIKVNERNAQKGEQTTTSPMTDELKKLHELKENGVLTDDEFQQAKGRILAGSQ